MGDRPLRAPDLEVTEVDGGLVIYQSSPERVHHLNNTAAYVFELSTGEWTVEQIAEQMQVAFQHQESLDQVVADCVGTLRWDGILR